MAERLPKIFYEIFESLPRQGPGDEDSTKRAFQSLVDLPRDPEILDIGCGTGTQTLILAKLTAGTITALDNHEPFIETLKSKIEKNGLADRIQCVIGDMASMHFEDKRFDLIWSEGSSFIVGFKNALKLWKPFLRPGGYMAISDLVWFKQEAPREIKDYFAQVDPNIKHCEEIPGIIEDAGYAVVDYFLLPRDSWWTYYYLPLEKRIAEFQTKYPNNKDAQEIFDSFLLEIDMFRKYSEYYGYGFYIMKKES